MATYEIALASASVPATAADEDLSDRIALFTGIGGADTFNVTEIDDDFASDVSGYDAVVCSGLPSTPFLNSVALTDVGMLIVAHNFWNTDGAIEEYFDVFNIGSGASGDLTIVDDGTHPIIDHLGLATNDTFDPTVSVVYNDIASSSAGSGVEILAEADTAGRTSWWACEAGAALANNGYARGRRVGFLGSNSAVGDAEATTAQDDAMEASILYLVGAIGPTAGTARMGAAGVEVLTTPGGGGPVLKLLGEPIEAGRRDGRRRSRIFDV